MREIEERKERPTEKDGERYRFRDKERVGNSMEVGIDRLVDRKNVILAQRRAG